MQTDCKIWRKHALQISIGSLWQNKDKRKATSLYIFINVHWLLADVTILLFLGSNFDLMLTNDYLYISRQISTYISQTVPKLNSETGKGCVETSKRTSVSHRLLFSLLLSFHLPNVSYHWGITFAHQGNDSWVTCVSLVNCVIKGGFWLVHGEDKLGI